MIFDLIAFGGVVFWSLLVISYVIQIVTQETGGSTVAFIVSLMIFYGLSQPPVIDWAWVVAYFLVGLVWWLIIFQYRLSRIKYWMDQNPDACKNNCGERSLSYIRITDPKISRYYKNEPSFATFMDRTFCWPASMFVIALEDIAKDIYDKLAHSLKAYKQRYLNLDS